jgi:hypothetical protein
MNSTSWARFRTGLFRFWLHIGYHVEAERHPSPAHLASQEQVGEQRRRERDQGRAGDHRCQDQRGVQPHQRRHGGRGHHRRRDALQGEAEVQRRYALAQAAGKAQQAHQQRHGQHTLLASYIDKNDRTRFDQDAHHLALGYRYNLSKRTELYAVYAKIANKHGAGYTVGNSIESGSGDKAVDLGIKHAF